MFSKKNNEKLKVIFAGGGTGGHIFPISAIAREIKNKNDKNLDIELIFIGPKNEISEELFLNEDVKIKNIITGKIRRYTGFSAIFQNFIDIFFKIPVSIIQSFFYIFFVSPDILISKGGYGAFAPLLCSSILQVPIFLHESDVSPGLVSKIFSRFALEIFVSFPETEKFPVEKMILTGNPIRNFLLEKPNDNEIKNNLNLTKKKPLVFIIGGSQGSEQINSLALSVLSQLLPKFQIIHQCGVKNYDEIKIQSDFLIPKEWKEDYRLFGFLNEQQLRSAYHASDLVISRSGSGSIFEIAALGKPSILIPITNSAQNHQIKNAYSYSKFKTGLVFEEKNITTPHLFSQKLITLIENEKTMKRMEERALYFSKPRSAEIIAEYIIEFLLQYLQE
jgi:UDP-N-acetylglucosamine--N-acetylmuramyl-(pentapeptide) pyrophosphoryl-undecaprenol N-acetylglucosamine transferase